MKKVLVFGTFDGLHPGHRAFLRQARRCGDHLTVAVAPDAIVRQLKGRLPKIEFSRRCEQLRLEPDVDEVVASDLQLGTWEILDRVNPDVIGLGYDQILLKESLVSSGPRSRSGSHPEIRVMGFHESQEPRS
jgi:cytidyltransferase-like protein